MSPPGRSLFQIEDSNLEDLQRQRNSVQELVNLVEMKEIKGISKRLSQLDEFLHKASALQKEQKQLCEAVLQQEQKVLSSVRDPDMTKGVCQIQRDTLMKILQNQQNLTEIACKFKDSKVELLDNIKKRLAEWITQTYQLMHEGNNQLTVYGERLMAAKKRLDLLKQIHEAPTIYALAVTEVLRRRNFSGDFKSWSSSLVEKSEKLREEEAELRTAFRGKLDKHFLKMLFGGMTDEMPPFASENPPAFDQNMPPLTPDDLRALRSSATSLAPLLQVSQRNVYERLSVSDPRDSFGGLKREASFFSQTPPKFLGSSRKFPSSTWLSGDENLDFSPTGGLMARSPPTSRGLGYEHFELTDISPVRLPREEGASSYSGHKSAPIRIPSRAPSDGMSTSRQLSEKSSRFGTPEEDLPMSPEDVGPSPPEMISGSQLKAEMSHLATPSKEETDILASSPAGIQVSIQTSFNGSMLEMDDGEKKEQLLDQKRKELEEKEMELSMERRKQEELSDQMEVLKKELKESLGELSDSAAAGKELETQLAEKETQRRKLEDICDQQKMMVNGAIKEHVSDLKDMREALFSCAKGISELLSYNFLSSIQTSAVNIFYFLGEKVFQR